MNFDKILNSLSDTSSFQTTTFNENGRRLFPVRKNAEDKTLTAENYVSIICDVLRMKKNICLCRHFHRMNKSMIAKSNHIRYIDVWPINVFDPRNEDPFDVVSLFMLQLGCIINMLPAWKRLHMRVFLCDAKEYDTMSVASNSTTATTQTFEKTSEEKLRQLLKLLRITASIEQIPEWSRNEDFLHHSSVLKQFTKNLEQNNDNRNNVGQESVNRAKLHMQG